MATYRLFSGALKIFDIGAMLVCFAAAAILVSPELNYVSLGQFLQLRLSVGNAFLLVGVIAFWYFVFNSLNLYASILRSGRYQKAVALLKATGIAVVGVAFAGVMFNVSFVNAQFLLIFWVFAFAVLLLARLIAMELIGRSNNRERHRPRLLIVGANPRSIRFAKQIESNPEVSHELIGFVDNPGPHLAGLEETAFELITDIDNLPEYLRQTPIDELVMCLPLKSHYDYAAKIVSHCEEQGIMVRILADLFQYQLSHSRTEQFGDTSVITLMTHSVTGLPALLKRAIDVVVSAAFIVLFSPLLIIVSLLILISSPGPILFCQERIGLNKKRFKMIKFRTMVQDAELQMAALESLNEASGPAFKIKADPRVTPIGRFLRTTSIDEMPQFFNVLKGDMSLVGPRPLPLRDYDGFTQDWHRRRVSVRPGITCLWQIKGRDQSSFEAWMKLDMQYIDQWSLLLDTKILLKTVPAVLRGSGE